MSTVFFSNYASNIYGKQNNVWILTDSRTGQEILNVKSTPYFIFTFTEIGNYTIYNKVEDSAGNVYSITKPGYIEVVNHKEKNPDDRNPDQVDSFDYGVPDAFAGRNYEVKKLGKSLAEEELRILKQNQIPFGVEVVIPNNPDATFRDIEP
jgi:PKD repeat protein